MINVIGIGQNRENMTLGAIRAIEESDVIVGYKKYVAQISDLVSDKEIIKKCELYNKFFHVMSEPFSLYFSYSQGTDTKRIRDQRYNSMY